MKHLLLAAIFLTQALFVLGQTPRTGEPAFDLADFNKKFAVAEWLARYDSVAWKTTDVLKTQSKAELARLGADWFCFQDQKGLWHAVYGKLEDDKFDLVSHFVVDSAGKITRTTDKIEGDFLLSHVRALITARTKLKESIPENSPLHNQYIKRNADQSFTVWVLPAFQPNGVAVYGGEFIYYIDPAGEKVTKDESYFQGAFRGFKADPPRDIWLNYREKEKPTLGAIFFVWYHKAYFTKIFIDNSKSTSTVIKNGTSYVWVHAEKDKSPADPLTEYCSESLGPYPIATVNNTFFAFSTAGGGTLTPPPFLTAFGTPRTSSPASGTTTFATPRQLQLAVKFDF